MKILIISNDTDKTYEIARGIEAVNDNLNIAPVFTTRVDMEHKITENFMYYMDGKQVELAYKNNALMWVWSNQFESQGVTLVDMYNFEIFVMNYLAFNNMSEPILETLMNTDDDTIIVFVDSKKAGRKEDELIESRFSLDRIYKYNCLYYCDDEVNYIVNEIINYIKADKLQRKEILKENS